MRRLVLAAMLALALVPIVALAEKAAPETADAARESVRSASLSPAGSRVAFLAPRGGAGNALDTVPVDGSGTVRIMGVRGASDTGDSTGVVRYFFRKVGSSA